VQTTLLGFAIAIILALTTALVGPLFVDWSRYRGEFEARANQLTGLDFHITGAIDARLLPTPTLVLHGIEVARPAELGNLRARALRIEFALGALARGEWRITDARVEGPQLAVGIDAGGRMDWLLPKVSFNPEAVSIERLHIQDGRATFADAASGSHLALEKLEFRGELRSLSGPVKGEGSFVVAGRHLPYRLSANRIDDGGIKLRLAVDPIDRPLTAEAEMSIAFDRGTPRFDGNIQFARPVGRAPAGSQSPIIEPWRLSSRIKGDSAAAVLEQIEFQYGPDERATKLRGTAHLRFGREPRINAALSSPQIDLDRMLSRSEARQRPLTAAKTLAEDISGNLRMPFPALLNVTIESLNLGGATMQRLTAELETDGEDLNFKTLDFRAPGVTQVRVSGKLATVASGVAFKGSGSIESNDPRALVAWLSDRGDAQPIAPGLMRLAGDVSFSHEAVVVEHFNLDLDRMNVAGRFAYMWEGHDRPARVDAALTTPDIDIDRIYALAQAFAGDTKFAWPAQGALSLKMGHASVIGVEARGAEANLRLDANGLAIDPLTVADFGGAALAVRGRIDTKSSSPRGAVTLDLDARALDGILTLLEKLAPDAAAQLRSSAGRVTPILLRASLIMDPGSASNLLANAKFKADGRAGMFRLAVLGDANTASEAFKADKLAAAGSAQINLIGRIDADDCQALIELARLDRFLAVDKRPAQLTLSAKGRLDGDLELDSRLVSGAVELSTNGKVHILPQANRRAELDLKATNVNVRSPRPVAGERAAELLPVSLTARLAMAGDALSLTDVKGSVAGAPVAGRLNLGMQRPMTIEGAIDLGAINLGGALATITGATLGGGVANADVVWPSEPFEQMLGPLNGRLIVKSARVTLTPKLEAHDFVGIAHFGESQFGLQATEGNVAGGRLSGELILLRQREGLVARTRFGLSGANAAELLPGGGAISGRLTFEAKAEGTGMSPIALIGALEGSGTFTLENGRLARLNPKAFDAIMRAVDQGLPIDANRLRDRTDSALSSGAFVLPRAEGAITIAAGQARLSNEMADERGNELALNARVNLAENELDARLVLTAATTSATSLPPEITVTLKGPVRAPNRSVDVAAFASWLALRAVEQQSKKLDVLEGRQPSAPLPGAANERPPNRPAINPSQIDGSTAAAAPPAAGPEAPHPNPPIRNVQKPKPPEPARPAPVESMPRQLLFGVQ
jgi:large subunit ribosomal protein L24